MPETSQPLSPFNVNRWFPSSFNRGPNWLVWVGLLASFTAVFIKLWTPISINRIPEALYTLPFFYALAVNFGWLKRDRIIQLFGLAILLPIVFYGINYLRDPVLAAEYEGLDNLAKLFFFVPIAWWLGGNLRTIGWFLTIAFAGLVTASLLDPNLGSTLKALFSGQRVDFNILNAQHVGLYYSLALIGLLSYLPTLIKRPYTTAGIVRAVLTIAAIGLCILVIIGTQTRAAWLALALCALLWVLTTAYRILKAGKAKQLIAPLLILTVSTTLFGVAFKEPIANRISTENTTLTAIVERDWHNIPYSSIGVRINTWIEAMPWIAERPIIGWGGDVRKTVIDSSERLPDNIKRAFGHFHNSYIEFTLAYGLVGLMVLLTLLYTLLQQTMDRGQLSAGTQSLATNTFSLYSIILLAIMNMFESYLFFWSGVYVASIVFAPRYSQELASSQSTAEPSKNQLSN